MISRRLRYRGAKRDVGLFWCKKKEKNSDEEYETFLRAAEPRNAILSDVQNIYFFFLYCFIQIPGSAID